jgi:hypothetical protein
MDDPKVRTAVQRMRKKQKSEPKTAKKIGRLNAICEVKLW